MEIDLFSGCVRVVSPSNFFYPIKLMGFDIENNIDLIVDYVDGRRWRLCFSSRTLVGGDVGVGTIAARFTIRAIADD